MEPVAKRSCRLETVRRNPVSMLAEQTQSDFQVQAEYAESRPSSCAASHEHSIAATGRSRGQDSESHEGSLWDSSVAEISVRSTSTIEPSTGASSSLVTPNSVRSSAMISGASSVLPVYSERASERQSQRSSTEFQVQHEPVLLPEHVYLPHPSDMMSNMHDIIQTRCQVCTSGG
jgi:hypothetical protein